MVITLRFRRPAALNVNQQNMLRAVEMQARSRGNKRLYVIPQGQVVLDAAERTSPRSEARAPATNAPPAASQEAQPAPQPPARSGD
jgi:hypothetical protein